MALRVNLAERLFHDSWHDASLFSEMTDEVVAFVQYRLRHMLRMQRKEEAMALKRLVLVDCTREDFDWLVERIDQVIVDHETPSL